MNVGVPACPSIRVCVVCDCVTKTSGSVNLAERIDSANKRVRLPPVRERSLQAVKHSEAGDGGVDGEEDIVGDNERLEPAMAGDPPRLVTVLTVVPVEVGDRSGVDGSNGQGNFRVKRLLEYVLRDLKRVRESWFAAVGVRDG